MKYLITESQYNKAIDKFISLQLAPHEVVHAKNHNFSWVKDDVTIAEYFRKSNDLFVKESIWDDIQDMFGLREYEVEDMINEWLSKHENFKYEKVNVHATKFF